MGRFTECWRPPFPHCVEVQRTVRQSCTYSSMAPPILLLSHCLAIVSAVAHMHVLKSVLVFASNLESLIFPFAAAPQASGLRLGVPPRVHVPVPPGPGPHAPHPLRVAPLLLQLHTSHIASPTIGDIHQSASSFDNVLQLP